MGSDKVVFLQRIHKPEHGGEVATLSGVLLQLGQCDGTFGFQQKLGHAQARAGLAQSMGGQPRFGALELPRIGGHITQEEGKENRVVRGLLLFAVQRAPAKGGIILHPLQSALVAFLLQLAVFGREIAGGRFAFFGGFGAFQNNLFAHNKSVLIVFSNKYEVISGVGQ
jgi:hypothetical protein